MTSPRRMRTERPPGRSGEPLVLLVGLRRGLHRAAGDPMNRRDADLLRQALADVVDRAVDAEARAAAATADAIHAKADRDAIRRERDDWRRQALLLADRRAELVEEVRSRDMKPMGRLAAGVDGSADL